jgi:hypothetical protein
MIAKQLTVLPVVEELRASSGWEARIFVKLDEMPVNGIPIAAEIGGQPLESLDVTTIHEPVMRGYVKAVPQPGDELVIFFGGTTVPTGLTVGDPAIA